MTPQKPNISLEEFEKLDIRVCKILSIEKVEKADKLYKMQIDTGIDKRIVISAIAHQITEEELKDMHFPFILNLEPRKIRGIESNAMIIMGTSVLNKKLVCITPSNFGIKKLAPEMNGYDNEITGAIII